MKPQMILDERRDEEIAVVVAVAQPQVQRHACVFARLPQQLGLELAFEERIARALVDEQRRSAPAAIGDQRRRVVVAPAPRSLPR